MRPFLALRNIRKTRAQVKVWNGAAGRWEFKRSYQRYINCVMGSPVGTKSPEFVAADYTRSPARVLVDPKEEGEGNFILQEIAPHNRR